ncbi:hypothetical protein [Aquimarina algiphila]|uniref:hypothetical protein n=1 Tax=Aquimarina algiphila TaxID=2047982 RepID=UPI0024939423|nr:hypothetical protein [Aquimarina algiphila]
MSKLRHIKKKYLFKEAKLPIQSGKPILKVDKTDSQTIKKNKSNKVPFLVTSDKEYIRGVFYNYNGKHTVLPIPDLTLVYYESAYQSNMVRKEKEKALFKKALSEDEVTEDYGNELYHYFGSASSCIISMFTSIESFINHIIPDNSNFQKVLKNKTEIYTKKQIQEHFKFWDKVKDVLPHFYDNKNFFSKSTPTNSHIVNLKNLRDEIVHTKSEIDYSTQEELMSRLLKFKYDECLMAIRKFMNYYKENYITECDCGSDF